MEKISVKICAGTHCYVMGGSELLALSEYLPKDVVDKVDISAVTCLSNCQDEEDMLKPPLVEINGKIIQKASIPGIVKSIMNELNL